MKKIVFLTLFISTLLIFGSSCQKEKNDAQVDTGCIKGRLEVQGTCANYTIKVIDGTIDPNLIQASWTNPATGKTHENVFRLEAPCDFPTTIKEGDEFYFKLIENPNKNCGICQAFYPTPKKALAIQVLTSGCEEVGINK